MSKERKTRVPATRRRKYKADLGWFEDMLQRPWTVTWDGNHLVFRRYSSGIVARVTLRQVFVGVVLGRLASHHRCEVPCGDPDIPRLPVTMVVR